MTKRYQNYINQSLADMAIAHPNLSKDALIALGPKQYSPSAPNSHQHGVLIIHGLLDTCSSMNSLYDSFCQQHYHVKSVLLPGHGRTPSDLQRTSESAWRECVDMAYHELSQEVNTITIIGLSTGATLACHLASRYPVSHLILFAPAFKLKRAPKLIVHGLNKLNDYLGPLGLHWLTKRDERCPHKYESIPTHSVYQLQKLMDHVSLALKAKPLACKILAIVSADDETISSSKAMDIVLKQANKNNKILLYSTEVTNHQPQIEVIASAIPQKQILNFSHVNMHIAPWHPRYGEHQFSKENYIGATTRRNIKKYASVFKRITYNPYYEHQLQIILDFIN